MYVKPLAFRKIGIRKFPGSKQGSDPGDCNNRIVRFFFLVPTQTCLKGTRTKIPIQSFTFQSASCIVGVFEMYADNLILVA